MNLYAALFELRKIDGLLERIITAMSVKEGSAHPKLASTSGQNALPITGALGRVCRTDSAGLKRIR
jgi:hypothetical protein